MKKILLILVFSFISLFAFEHLTVKNIDEKTKKGNYIVDFYAIWCPPCAVIDKNLESYDKEKKAELSIYKVDIDQQRALLKKYSVKSIPTLLYIKDGKVLDKIRGVKTLEDLVKYEKKYFN